MTVNRPERPVSVREEIALAETRDLPPRIQMTGTPNPIAVAKAIAEAENRAGARA